MSGNPVDRRPPCLEEFVMFNKTAVIGAGIMGRGISLVYAMNGCKVNLFDADIKALEKAKDLIGADLELMIEESLCPASRYLEILDNILVTESLGEAVASVEFITEAVPESLELKWQVLARLEELSSKTAIIASNTSTLPLSDLAKHLVRPERVIITHFFNPAHLVPLVEVIKTEATPDEALADILTLLRRIGKVPVVLKKEVPGFIANRLQAAVMREALHLVHSGVASLHDVDAAMTCGPGFRWSIIGPLETADFGGLDTWQSVMANLAPELDNAQTVPAVIKELNKQGHLGVKTGQGFYTYPTGEVVADKIYRRDLDFIRLLKLRTRD
jgi:3-hydroxybutyryl-CoA dehydrogenase